MGLIRIFTDYAVKGAAVATGAELVLKLINSSQGNQYWRERERQRQFEKELEHERQKSQREQADKQARENAEARQHMEREAEKDRQLEEYRIREETALRRKELENAREIAEIQANSDMYAARMDSETRMRIHQNEILYDEQKTNKQIEYDAKKTLAQFEHDEEMQKRAFAYEDDREGRRMTFEQNLTNQKENFLKLQQERQITNDREIARFQALANRETQVLIARENAMNTLQDKMVQDALKDFPLNISPIVLLKNRPRSLDALLRFSTIPKEGEMLPDIGKVYDEVTAYSEQPEPYNVFFAPVHISSAIPEKEVLSNQIWDLIYEKVEKFFITFYNRCSKHPVVLYPTAWKNSATAGQHASETLHFFLKDLPCLVIEPRFTGNYFDIVLSCWNMGYQSNELLRTQSDNSLNMYILIMEEVYNRSVKALNVIKKIDGKLTPRLKEKKEQLEQNVEYFKILALDKEVGTDTIDELQALGINELFSIDPSQDLSIIVDMMASLIIINISVMADAHHLQSTDTWPEFPQLFKSHFNEFYQNKELREKIAECFTRILTQLRAEDSLVVGESYKPIVERTREMQIENIRKELELIDENDIKHSIEKKLRTFLKSKLGDVEINSEAIWDESIEHMNSDDIPFFKELIPNVISPEIIQRIEYKIWELNKS